MTNQQQNSNENVSNNGVYNIPKQKKKIKKIKRKEKSFVEYI